MGAICLCFSVICVALPIRYVLVLMPKNCRVSFLTTFLTRQPVKIKDKSLFVPPDMKTIAFFPLSKGRGIAMGLHLGLMNLKANLAVKTLSKNPFKIAGVEFHQTGWMKMNLLVFVIMSWKCLFCLVVSYPPAV